MTRTSRLALQLAVLLLMTVVCSAQADPIMPWSRSAHPQRPLPPNFGVAGVYGGVVGDQLTIDGMSYHLRPNTQAYVLGVGLVPVMSLPIGSHVFATGVGSMESGSVASLVVRPADEERAQNADMSAFVHERKADSPM
jgi:hypothetical protein